VSISLRLWLQWNYILARFYGHRVWTYCYLFFSSWICRSVCLRAVWCLLKSSGVKLKVWVTDEDLRNDDAVDGLVLRLNPTPSRSSSSAYWISTSVSGQRSRRPTRSINAFFCQFFSSLCAVRVGIYFTANRTCNTTVTVFATRKSGMTQ